ncbi:MAG: hypothetical protein ACYTAF_17490, partial [Planctomycetota bacterium]|jgi:hypothetical protein
LPDIQDSAENAQNGTDDSLAPIITKATLAQAASTGEIVDEDPLNQGGGSTEADPHADKELIPEDVLTDEQYELIKHHVEMMPDRFRMGTEAVRSFITAAIKQVDPSFSYSTIRGLTQAHGDIVIQAQKDFIRAEADKYNGQSKAAHVR